MSTTEPLLAHRTDPRPPDEHVAVDCSRAMPPSSARGLCIDEVLAGHAGEFGAWQLRHFVLTSLAWALEAFHTMVMIFADSDPPWRCLDPMGCSGGGGGSGYICRAAPGPTTWDWVGGSAASTVAQWGMVCGDKYKVGLVQSAFFAGCMVGAGVFGHLSDSFVGRKGSLTVVCALNLIFGALTALSPTYWVYLLLRFLTGFSTGGVGLCAFVLSTEPVGPSRRGVVGMSTFYFFSSGIAALCGIAFLARPWRLLYVATSLPSLLFLLLVVPFLTESPRWYLVRGRVKEAMKVMHAIAAGNGRRIPDDVTLVLDDDNNNDAEYFQEAGGGKDAAKISGSTGDIGTKPAAASGSVLDAIRSPLTRTRLILMVAINLLCSVVYYGLSLNVTNLKINLYLSVLLNAVAEMPAYLLTALLLDRLGRRPLSVVTMWFSGATCLAGSLLPVQGWFKALRVACGVAGIFGMAATYNLLFIYTAELFPTVVRNAALGCATQGAQLGAILAPIVVVMGESIPFAVFGACGVVGGLLAVYLPETKDKPLYDTMAGMEGGEGQISKADHQRNGCQILH